jgi:hypothetical protein
MLIVFLQSKLMSTFYDEVVYHNGNISIGFYILINGLFILYYGIYSMCALGAYNRNRQMLKIFVIYQICVVGIPVIIGIFSAYIIVGGKNKNSVGPYDYKVTTISYENENYEVRAIDAVCVGSFIFLILEIYCFVFTI